MYCCSLNIALLSCLSLLAPTDINPLGHGGSSAKEWGFDAFHIKLGLNVLKSYAKTKTKL